MKNCGECIQKLCMPFAFAVIKGEASISDCKLLSTQELANITTKLVKTDWREDLIAKLRENVKKTEFSKIAEDIGGDLRGQNLIIKFYGREFEISPDGQITTEGYITPWMKILLLSYIKTAGRGALIGRWITFSELKDGMLKSSAFNRDCEEHLNEIFDRSMDKCVQILQKLGAVKQSGFATQNAWIIDLLPRIPVLILYWEQEEDIPSQTRILFDASVDRFLDAESLVFLVDGFLKNIEYEMGKIR